MSPEPAPRGEERGRPPVGALAVVGTLLLAISTLWLLVLGILEGRS